MKQNRKKYLALLAFSLFSFLIWKYFLKAELSFENLKLHQAELENFLAEHFLLSLLVYCLVYISVVSLSLPVSIFMTLVGGFLFGQWLGTFLVVFSCSVGACLVVLLLGFFSPESWTKKAQVWAKKIGANQKNNVFWYVLGARLFPFFPYMALNLVAGISKLPRLSFFLGTVFGVLPLSFLYVSIGVSLKDWVLAPNFSWDQLVSWRILVIFSLLGAFALLPILIQRLKGKGKKTKRTEKTS